VCGISGFVYNKNIDPNVLANMLNTLHHRGPDSRGTYKDGAYQGGMTRLAINGLNDGNQPLFDEHEDVVLFYNGEIYNAPILRRELEQKGYKFKTHSDGEVITHLYREYQEELFSYLDGMFAVALWIKSERKLILGRDIPGEKPLYYAPMGGEQCVFASEIKSIRAFQHLELNLNKQAIWDFPTFLWVPEPNTIYEEVFALPAGHILISQNNNISIKPYNNKYTIEIAKNSSDKIEQIRSVVTQAIESRLLSDVPVGCFLSSGLDSSIVSTIASQNQPIHTFCVAFEDVDDPYHGRSNESDAAKEYSKTLNTTHITVPVTAKYFTSLLDDFCHYGDQPYAVSSGLGILSVAKSAREHGIKVLLSGDGADECFGGYSWYQHLDSVKSHQAKKTQETFSFQNFGWGIEKRLSYMNSLSSKEQAYAWHYYAHEKEKSLLFNTEWFSNVNNSVQHFETFSKNKHWEPRDFIEQDRQFYFPNEMLSKLDRMNMAYSVEARAPFAAPSVHALAKQLKFNDMIKDNNLKWMLRQAFSDVLPKKVLTRKKHGFNVPIDHWLKEEWKDLLSETFSTNSALSKLGIIHKDSNTYANQLLSDKIRLNGHSIFCLIMLNKWLCNEQN
jgi:asparagine synthase (glutamine-hydrolysing)